MAKLKTIDTHAHILTDETMRIIGKEAPKIAPKLTPLENDMFVLDVAGTPYRPFPRGGRSFRLCRSPTRWRRRRKSCRFPIRSRTCGTSGCGRRRSTPSRRAFPTSVRLRSCCRATSQLSPMTGPIAVIAPGTGLGESFLTWDGSHYLAHASEGGHSDFAPTDERQVRLLEYLLRRFDHVGVERVCSGIGVPNIYEFLRDGEGMAEQPDVDRAIASARDRTKAIVNAAVYPERPSELCRTTIDMLVSILASEAGNLFLKVFATGGIYVAGGIALHLLDQLQSPRFMETFTRKGRFKTLMERVPVHVITARAALVGAAVRGLESLKGSPGAIRT